MEYEGLRNRKTKVLNGPTVSEPQPIQTDATSGHSHSPTNQASLAPFRLLGLSYASTPAPQYTSEQESNISPEPTHQEDPVTSPSPTVSADGRTILLKLLFRIGTHIFSRVIAQSADDMLRGTLVDGIKAEHSLQLYQAIQTFQSSASPLVDRLNRLSSALNTVPDNAFVGYGQGLKESLELVYSGAELISTLNSGDSALQKLQKAQHHLSQLIKNNLLCKWTTDSSTLRLIDQAGKLIDEIAPLLRSETSLEEVMNWAKSSEFLEGLLKEHYRSMVEVFDELGQLTSLLRTRQAAHPEASALSHAAWLFKILSESRIGPFVSTHLFTALEPVISKLLSISSTVSLLLSFPAQSPASFQIKWLLGHMSDAQVRTVLPWPLVALTERLTHVLGTNPDLCEVIGACPAQGDLPAQIPWLIRAFQHPQFKDLTHKQFHARLFDTLNSWKSSAVGLHQHLKAFPGFQSPLPSIQWTAQLLNSPALAEIEAIMPAVQLNDLAGWVLPVRSTLQLTSQLAPYPSDAPWQERLVWGAQLLMQEQTTELLSFFLPPSISTRLVQPLGIIRQASTFPKDHSYTEQLRWSASLLGSPSGQAVLKQFAPSGFDEFFAQLSISDDMFSEARMLRQTLSSDAPWQQKAWHVYALLMPALKQVLKRNPEWVLRGVGWATGGNKTSVGLTLTALRVYMTMPEGLDWFGQFKWITTCTFHELTNEYSFIASTLIANGVYTATFSRYVYQVFEIYKNWSSPERTEAQLVELVNILKRDLAMPEHLQPLLDVIPALPALLSTGKAYMALPATMPMGQQALKIVEHLAHTDSAALTRLYDAIENYAVGGISQGINQVLQAIPDPLTLLPGASAAPVEQKDTLTAPHTHRHSTHSARAEIGVGLGGLIASTIGGLWAYANWHQASSTAFSSVPTGELEQEPEPELELKTFASNQPLEESQILQPELSKLKPPTSPIPNKAKIVAGISLLGAVASGGLIAKGIYDLTAHKALTLDEVQVYTRADLYSGDREALLEDIDLFLELLGPGIAAPIKLFNSNEPTSSTTPPASTQFRTIDPDVFFSPVLNYVPETENKHVIEKRSPNMQMAAAMKELGQIKNEKRRREEIQKEQRESAKRRAIEERRTEELRKQQKIRDSLALSISRNERAQLAATISKTTLQNTTSDLLAQMKLAQSLRKNINDMQTAMRDLTDIDPVWKLLESTKTRILDIRNKIAQLVNVVQTETFLSNADLYALGLLEEMRDYYPEDTVNLWDNFLPFNFITYYYKGPHGERHIAEARFIDFLNGKVWHKLDQEEASEPFRFSAAREATEVAEDMRAGYTNYTPKAWTKNKYLNSEASRLSSDGIQIPLHMSDPITIKYQKYSSPTEFTKTGPILELVVTLDTYLRGGRWVELGLPPGRFSKEAVIWPAHYPDGLGERLYTLDSRKQYLKGEWAFHNLNIRLESLRTQEQLSFEDTIAKFSSSDLVRDAELLTQQSWETMMFDNHGTPIGFTRNDVLSGAINTVEQRIVSYDKECESGTLSPVLVNLYKSEIKKLYALLSVLHQKTEQSLELVSQDENKDAQFDTQRRDFVAEFWTDPHFATRLLAHNCLKNLSPDSPLTIKIEKNNVPSLFTMSLIRILCDEHTRHAPANSKVDVQWPEGLSNNDPLLQEMMDTSATYARMLKRGVDAESAFQRIKITTIEEELQQGLDRISQSKASAAKPVALIKLAETVTVRFHPTYPYKRRQKKNAIFDSTRIDNSHPPVDMEFTLLELMAKQPQMELIGMPWHNRLEVDISKKFNPDVIKDLIKIDWQKKIESNIEKMKSDTQLRCDWALVFGSLINSSLSAAEVETAKTLTVNNRLTPGVYLINTKDNKLQVHSVFSSWVWKFNSNEELVGALETPLKSTSATSLNASSATLSNMNATTEQQNDQFYTWLNAHQEKKYQSESLGSNWINTNPSSRADKIAEQVLSGLLTVMKSDADMRLKSSSELGTHKFFKILEDLAPVFGALLMPLTGPMAFLAAVGMASVTFLELLVADTTEEFRSIAIKSAINAAFEVGPNIAVAGVSKIPARQIAKEIGKKLNTVKAILPGAQKTVERVASSIKTPLEPFRQTPSGTVGNLTEGTNQYLTKLKAHSTIAEAFNNPNGQCEILMDLVSTQIQGVDIGMTNIRFRAVQIWNNAMEQMPTHHFAVIGSKGNQDFVFDLSAHQFANKGMPDLTGPLILEEAEWAQKISNATTRKLIKYKDFSTSSQAAREFNSLPGHSPLDFIDGGVLLSIPQWYKQVTGWNPSGIARVGNTKILNLNPVLEAAKANRLGSKGVCWDYAVGVLNEANMISREGGQRLTRGLINASNYKGLWGDGRINNLIRGPRAIKTMDELLKVRQGEMLIFMEVDPNMPLKGARPIHAMTSTGDGIFTGNKSTVLDSSLGDGKVILPAEHLGTFEGGQFTRAKGLPNSPKVEILAGYPMGVKSPFAPSLTQAAHSVIHKASMTQLNSGHIDFAATVLETSGSLGNRQALAFRKVAQKIHAPQANSESMSIDELLKDLKPITSLDTLKTVKTGEILVATRDNAPIKNIMVSLGDGKYAASALGNLDPKLPKTNGIVTAETLYASMSNDKIGGFDLKSGSVNLTSKSMRVHTILGDHSRYTVLDSSLKFITASPSSDLNFMDAGELFHTAKVVMEHNPGLGTLDHIKLQTHFAGLGDPAVAQTLSNLLQKPVKVPGYRDNSWRPSVKIYSPQPAFTMTDEAQAAILAQQSRTRGLWNRLLNQYSNLNSRLATASFRTRRSIGSASNDSSDSTGATPSSTPFEDLINNAGDLIMAKPEFDVDMFIAGEDSYPADAKTALQVLVDKGIPDNASEFASRMIQVLSLTKDSLALMNDFVSTAKPLT